MSVETERKKQNAGSPDSIRVGTRPGADVRLRTRLPGEFGAFQYKRDSAMQSGPVPLQRHWDK